MARRLSILYVAITALVIIFQCAVIAGAPLGSFTQGGASQGALGPEGRMTAAISIVILLLTAIVIYRYGSKMPSTKSPLWLRITFPLVFTLNCLEFVLNWITPSESERLVWGPVNTVLFGCVIAIAWTQRQARRKDKTL